MGPVNLCFKSSSHRSQNPNHATVNIYCLEPLDGSSRPGLNASGPKTKLFSSHATINTVWSPFKGSSPMHKVKLFHSKALKIQIIAQ